jgi:hypothetical protein
MVDLEIVGKRERQGHLDTVISGHVLDDVKFARGRLAASQLMVRINPIHDATAAELDVVVTSGADIVMLPMFKTVGDVQTFVSLLAGRARSCLLLETKEALGRAEQILGIPGIDEVHVGLNDLHLALGLDFMFEVLAGGLLDHLSRLCHAKGIKFGFGGIARLGHGILPASNILMEHARLGSTQVILSRDFRAFFDDRPMEVIKTEFADAVRSIRECYEQATQSESEQLERNRRSICARICEIISTR